MMLSKDILIGSVCAFGFWALIYEPGVIKIKIAKFFETSQVVNIYFFQSAYLLILYEIVKSVN